MGVCAPAAASRADVGGRGCRRRGRRGASTRRLFGPGLHVRARRRGALPRSRPHARRRHGPGRRAPRGDRGGPRLRAARAGLPRAARRGLREGLQGGADRPRKGGAHQAGDPLECRRRHGAAGGRDGSLGPRGPRGPGGAGAGGLRARRGPRHAGDAGRRLRRGGALSHRAGGPGVHELPGVDAARLYRDHHAVPCSGAALRLPRGRQACGPAARGAARW
mmetsp:Transcript_123286/g.343296  ORF Transcript_123286/g.343296 Transcript_123286/m.343296 type:complete len:220 (-) Transcript_123286:297-956(-)